MSEWIPKTPEQAEAYDYGYSRGIENALGELHEIFGADLEQTDLWKEYVDKGVTN